MAMNKPMRSQSGRWFRRGGNIVVVLGNWPAAEEREVSIARAKPFWQRAIHPRIDVDAQRALISMEASGNPSDVRDATVLLNAIAVTDNAAIVGPVYGIYKQDQGVPAQYFRSKGTNWWTALEGRKSTYECIMPRSMMIVVRKNLSQEELKVELRMAALTVRTGSLCR
jgi:hypothetical protein